MKRTETPVRFVVDNPVCDFGLDLVRLVKGLGLADAIFGNFLAQFSSVSEEGTLNGVVYSAEMSIFNLPPEVLTFSN
jgi:hypothetical protein